MQPPFMGTRDMMDSVGDIHLAVWIHPHTRGMRFTVKHGALSLQTFTKQAAAEEYRLWYIKRAIKRFMVMR